MKESKILGMFQQHSAAIQQLNQQIMMIGNNANKIIGQLAGNITNISIIVDTMMEYDRKYWMFPKAFWPGKKLFAKIYNRRVQEIKDQHEEALKKQQEAVEAAKGPAPSGTIPNETDKEV